jgi:hypothetical protein
MPHLEVGTGSSTRPDPAADPLCFRVSFDGAGPYAKAYYGHDPMLIEAKSGQNSKFEPIQAATHQPIESAEDQSLEGNGEIAVEVSPHSSPVHADDDTIQENATVVAATGVVTALHPLRRTPPTVTSRVSLSESRR